MFVSASVCEPFGLLDLSLKDILSLDHLRVRKLVAWLMLHMVLGNSGVGGVPIKMDHSLSFREG